MVKFFRRNRSQDDQYEAKMTNIFFTQPAWGLCSSQCFDFSFELRSSQIFGAKEERLFFRKKLPYLFLFFILLFHKS